ncbi:lipopolysaccharide biosynthesis protein [Companilactobacillus farciminis]|uniref:lipopolysaccharide biosynthesis protein n=1 Tax=Companilactobacillus farciminis TaxID=1612 RepID=UPI0019161E96|nr:transporter [Companilactobacillus farciminis]
MNNDSSSRWRNVILNSGVLTLLQFFTIILRFINQTVFIRILGKEFLGLNGLFANLLTYLSFAELGIGISIVFSLYKPLHDNDKKKISALMNFLKRAYIVIGIIIILLGIFLLPILPYVIKDYGSISYVPFYFILYLSNSAISYFYTYKRSILIADQKEYKSSFNTFKYTLIQTVIQILVLYYFKAYSIYLIVATICTFISNISISNLVNKEYPYLNSKNNFKLKLNRIELHEIKNNIIGMVGSRIGSIVVRSTDNLLLSTFMGLAVVGVYSNYLLIVTSVSTVLLKLISSVTASVGNLVVENNSKKSFFIYNSHFYVNLIMTGITSACLLVSLNPFIEAWVGKTYVLSKITVLVIVINYFIDQLRQSSIVFVSAYGLFVPNGKKSIIEAIVNFLLSLFFLTEMKLGIQGVLLGTIVTNLIVNSWFEPFIIFKNGFHLVQYFLKFYLKTYLFNLLLMIFIIGLLSSLIGIIDSYIQLPMILIAIMNSMIISVLLLLIILVIFKNQANVVYIREKIFKKIFSKK